MEQLTAKALLHLPFKLSTHLNLGGRCHVYIKINDDFELGHTKRTERGVVKVSTLSYGDELELDLLDRDRFDVRLADFVDRYNERREVEEKLRSLDVGLEKFSAAVAAAGLSTAEALELIEVFEANPDDFRSPGALLWRVEHGAWPTSADLGGGNE